MNWYALRTGPVARSEFTVMHLLNQNEHPAMVPFEEKWVRRPKTKHRIARKYPFFPRYVFCGFQSVAHFLAARDKINAEAERVGRPPPILSLVGYGTQPATLSAKEVEFLKRLSIPRTLTTLNIHKGLQRGTDVQILDGPFAGHLAKIDAISKRKVKVMLQMFGSMQLIEISAAALEVA